MTYTIHRKRNETRPFQRIVDENNKAKKLKNMNGNNCKRNHGF